MNSTHALHFDKYKAIDGTYFGFEIFDEVFKVINERGYRNRYYYEKINNNRLYKLTIYLSHNDLFYSIP